MNCFTEIQTIIHLRLNLTETRWLRNYLKEPAGDLENATTAAMRKEFFKALSNAKLEVPDETERKD